MNHTPVAAVVSAYQPTASLREIAVELSSQVDAVLVVDDTGDGGRSLAELGLKSLGIENLEIISNSVNEGLAASLNTGLRKAADMNIRLAVTFDQDSIVPKGYIQEIATHLLALQESGVTALVAGPQFVGGRSVPPSHTWAGGCCSLYHIQSGMIFDLDVFARVGFFREDFIIDGLEQEFALRLHRSGLHLSICPNLDIGHEIGSPKTRSMFGRPYEISGHSPYRRYYIWRNHLTWIKEGWADEREFTRGGLLWLIKWSAISLVLEPPRLRIATASIRGILDFVRGRYGKWTY